MQTYKPITTLPLHKVEKREQLIQHIYRFVSGFLSGSIMYIGDDNGGI